MNENLQEALAAIVTRAVEGVDTATAFIQGEAPEVLVQILHWNFAISLIWFVSFPAILAIMVYAAKKTSDKISAHCGDGGVWKAETPFPVFGCFGSYLIALLFFVTCIGNVNLEWLQIWIAPKVWLLEYAANLVK